MCHIWISHFFWVEWVDSFICAKWLIHMCDSTHSYVQNDLCICVTWLVFRDIQKIHCDTADHVWNTCVDESYPKHPHEWVMSHTLECRSSKRTSSRRLHMKILYHNYPYGWVMSQIPIWTSHVSHSSVTHAQRRMHSAVRALKGTATCASAVRALRGSESCVTLECDTRRT